ncbi:MAG: pentapeptide repeat-containing protein [Hormoscilla sp.]
MANQEHLAKLKLGVDAWNDWRKQNPQIEPDLFRANLLGANLAGANLRGVNLNEANLSGADFSGANLQSAELIGANLSRTNLSGAILSEATLSEAILSKANLTGAYLSGADFIKADLNSADLNSADLSRADLSKADLSKADLSGADLFGADLFGADLLETNLSRTDLSSADLRGAFLTRTHALGANFKEAFLTGACLEDWQINSATELDGVICEYFYLQYPDRERRPESGSLAPGEFRQMFGGESEIVELIFAQGIDWKAFFSSFNKVQTRRDAALSIQALEKKRDGALAIRVYVPADANKARVQQYLQREYELELKASDRAIGLMDVDEETAEDPDRSTDLREIAHILASSHITVEGVTQAENGAGTAGITAQENGLATVQDLREQLQDNLIDDGSDPTECDRPSETIPLASTAGEIQQVLCQMSQTYPTSTPVEKLMAVAEAVRAIESDRTRLQRVVDILKAGGTAALQQAIDHPLAQILLAALSET